MDDSAVQLDAAGFRIGDAGGGESGSDSYRPASVARQLPFYLSRFP